MNPSISITYNAISFGILAAVNPDHDYLEMSYLESIAALRHGFGNCGKRCGQDSKMIGFTISAGAAFVCSLGISRFIVMRRRQNTLGAERRDDLKAVQAAHVAPVPRIGGVAVVGALCLAATLWFFLGRGDHFAPMLLLTIVPVFVAGILEDTGFFTSPLIRLIGAIVSGILFVWVYDQHLVRVDLPGLDKLMLWAPFAIGFSIFIAAGISHAFNLIDGLNGLAAGIAIAAAFSLAFIADSVSLPAHRDALLFLSAAIAGFMFLNFPFARIFLGDAGAYAIGHVLVWIAISIAWNVSDITPWAILLIFFWPVADTILAITRRIRLGKPISHPDRLHFHQLVMRAVEIILIGRKNRRIANPLATLIVLPFAVAPMMAGIVFAKDQVLAAVAVGVFGFLFILTYKIGMLLACRFRQRTYGPMGRPALTQAQ